MHGKWREMHQHGECHHGPHPMGALVATSALAYMGIAIWLTFRLTNALEIMAMAKALDKLGDRLSDAEKTAIEGRMRETLFHKCGMIY